MNKIIQFIKNNWFVIALAFVPPLTIYFFLERETAGLEITIGSLNTIVSVQEGFSQEIEIKHKNKKIHSLKYVDISVENTGTIPFTKNDFIVPITISFNNIIASLPDVISSKPNSIKPIFTLEDEMTVKLGTDLLNPDDIFTFRTLVIDNDRETITPSISARVRNVKNVEVYNESENSLLFKKYNNWFNVTIIALFVSLSSAILSITRFFSRVSWNISTSQLKTTSIKLEEEENVAVHSKEIAQKLKISNHDFKSNLLVLRIKIESLLFELSHFNDIKLRGNRSTNFLAKLLEERNIISHDVAAAISDILPAVNKELHSTESYLSEDEFIALQKLGLNIVAALEIQSSPFTSGSPCQMSGQKCPGCNEGIMDVDGNQEGVLCNKCGLYVPAS